MPAHIDLGFVLSFMREALVGRPSLLYPNFIEATLTLMANAGVIDVPSDAKNSGLHATIDRDNKQLSELVAEAIQYLLHNGYISRPSNPPNFPGEGNVNAFRVTQIGKEWAGGNEPIPEDTVRFMKHLKALVPNLDNVIEQYVGEALVTYERRAYLAAAVMIGAAAEKAVYLLATAMQKSLASKPEKSRLIKVLNERRLPSLFKLISENLERAKKKKLIPYSIHEGSDPHLRSFFAAIRVQRNDAVHPAAGPVNASTVRLSISAFPQACKKVHDLTDWLKSKRI